MWSKDITSQKEREREMISYEDRYNDTTSKKKKKTTYNMKVELVTLTLTHTKWLSDRDSIYW